MTTETTQTIRFSIHHTTSCSHLNDHYDNFDQAIYSWWLPQKKEKFAVSCDRVLDVKSRLLQLVPSPNLANDLLHLQCSCINTSICCKQLHFTCYTLHILSCRKLHLLCLPRRWLPLNNNSESMGVQDDQEPIKIRSRRRR